MGALDHWHPVLRSSQLKSKPVAVKLCGQQIVLFRGEQNLVGALLNRCPHRGMQLSAGWVKGGRLVCPYHGWSYDCNGKGLSPSTPQLHACVGSYEVVERYNTIWVKTKGSVVEFPQLDVAGYHYVCTLSHHIRAPLELVVDNFVEVEHTGSTHALLGYAQQRVSEIETHVEVTDKTVRVTNFGPQKPIPWFIERIYDIRTGDWFTDDWTTYFSPVYTIYEQWWSSPSTGEPRQQRMRIAVFFNPVDSEQTNLVTFVYSTIVWGQFGFHLLLKPLLTRLVDYEIRLDQQMVERIADKHITLGEMQLGRFDRALVETRKRIDRIYRV